MIDHSTVKQLYPFAQERPLVGTYLTHQLQAESRAERPFVYANFVTSLDGRIAIPHPSRGGLMVPQNIANVRDWRLFQELAAQADLLISSGRYLRDWADGRAQEILRTDDPAFADLKAWRIENGLSPQPDLAIISDSLDFPIPKILTQDGRNVVIFTSNTQDLARVAEIEASAGQVHIVGDHKIDGAQMVRKMGVLGYRTVYSVSGPKILHLLLAANVLDRLYLTNVTRLIGGDPFASIVDGPLLDSAIDLRLSELYIDSVSDESVGEGSANAGDSRDLAVNQLFGSYTVNRHEAE